MRTVTITEKYDKKRIDRVIISIFPKAPVSAIYKALRKRDIKVNGARVKEEYIVTAGDKVDLYISDDVLDGSPAKDGFIINKGFSIVYEDSNLVIVNKNQGISVHPDRDSTSGTLIDNLKLYLSEKGEYDPGSLRSFAPALCHRLDRNTGGLVIAAKNERSLEFILKKIKLREIRKYYQCLVSGVMSKHSDELHAYLLKDERKSRVFISPQKVSGSVEIITRYRVLSSNNDISRLEIELVTGRTHQIRAHLAYAGHPIIGDGKYGTNAINRPLGAHQQALWAYKIFFDFKDDGFLSYLKGHTFEIEPEFHVRNDILNNLI